MCAGESWLAAHLSFSAVLAVLLTCLVLAAGAVGPARGVAYADSSSISESASASARVGDTAPTATGPFEDATTVDLDDGLYLVDVTLEGGSGRASVSSPAELEVFDGRGVMKLVWSSPNYDYMVVAGKKYPPVNQSGDSTFVVPVTAYDTPVPVVGDTTAMSEAHEVDYTVTVALGSAKPYDADAAPSASGNTAASAASSNEAAKASSSTAAAQSTNAAAQEGLPWPWVVFIVCVIVSAVCIGVTVGILRGYRNR